MKGMVPALSSQGPASTLPHHTPSLLFCTHGAWESILPSAARTMPAPAALRTAVGLIIKITF